MTYGEFASAMEAVRECERRIKEEIRNANHLASTTESPAMQNNYFRDGVAFNRVLMMVTGRVKEDLVIGLPSKDKRRFVQRFWQEVQVRNRGVTNGRV